MRHSNMSAQRMLAAISVIFTVVLVGCSIQEQARIPGVESLSLRARKMQPGAGTNSNGNAPAPTPTEWAVVYPTEGNMLSPHSVSGPLAPVH